MMQSDFGRARSGLSNAARRLDGLLEVRGARDDRERLQEWFERQDRSAVTLAVLGEIKVGKSTFVNALLGSDTMPADVEPNTSVVSRIRHGGRDAYWLISLDGARRELRSDQYKVLVTERGNPANRERIARFELECPSAALAQTGLEIVDTPGLGGAGIYERHSEVTLSLIPAADAVVFLLDARFGLGRQEEQFLEDIRRHVVRDNFFFVLNKSDLMKPDEMADQQECVQQELEKRFAPARPAVFALSAKAALAARTRGDDAALGLSGIPRLEDAIGRLLTVGRTRAKLLQSAAGLRTLAGRCARGIELERRGLETPLEQLRGSVDAIQEKLASLRKKEPAILNALALAIDDHEKETGYDALRDALTEKLSQVIDEAPAAELEAQLMAVASEVCRSWAEGTRTRLILRLKNPIEAAELLVREIDELGRVLSDAASPDGSLFQSVLGKSFAFLPPGAGVFQGAAGIFAAGVLAWVVEGVVLRVVLGPLAGLLAFFAAGWLHKQVLQHARESQKKKLAAGLARNLAPDGAMAQAFAQEYSRLRRELHAIVHRAVSAAASSLEDALGRAVADRELGEQLSEERAAELDGQSRQLADIVRGIENALGPEPDQESP